MSVSSAISKLWSAARRRQAGAPARRVLYSADETRCDSRSRARHRRLPARRRRHAPARREPRRRKSSPSRRRRSSSGGRLRGPQRRRAARLYAHDLELVVVQDGSRSRLELGRGMLKDRLARLQDPHPTQGHPGRLARPDVAIATAAMTPRAQRRHHDGHRDRRPHVVLRKTAITG